MKDLRDLKDVTIHDVQPIGEGGYLALAARVADDAVPVRPYAITGFGEYLGR